MSSIPDYTIVTATDSKHIGQLELVWSTWAHHKPSLLEHPMIVFIDMDDLDKVPPERVCEAVDHPHLSIYYWPYTPTEFPHKVYDSKDKFGQPQRYKMMAGFVYIPAACVETPYWLKLDSDVVAFGKDNWINPEWFVDYPAMIGHRWGFTKPASFPGLLDDWAEKHDLGQYWSEPPLNLPLDDPTSERISHPRVSSWCAFFNTEFTQRAAWYAQQTCGTNFLPVPSQDTYLWYLARRMYGESGVRRVNMKDQTGFTYKSNLSGVRELVKESLGVV